MDFDEINKKIISELEKIDKEEDKKLYNNKAQHLEKPKWEIKGNANIQREMTE